jgi:hypothetical protein
MNSSPKRRSLRPAFPALRMPKPVMCNNETAAICVVPDRLRCGQLSRLPAVGSQTCRNTCGDPPPTSDAGNQSSLAMSHILTELR